MLYHTVSYRETRLSDGHQDKTQNPHLKILDLLLWTVSVPLALKEVILKLIDLSTFPSKPFLVFFLSNNILPDVVFVLIHWLSLVSCLSQKYYDLKRTFD